MESDPCSPRDCPFPTWGCNCTKNYKNLFDAYVETYTILFSLIALVSIAQLVKKNKNFLFPILQKKKKG